MDEIDILKTEADAVIGMASPATRRYITEARLLNAEVDRKLAAGYVQNERGEWIAPSDVT